MFLEVLDAIEHCHENGVYHRDVKSENVLVSNEGHLYLCDFGLAAVDSGPGGLEGLVGSLCYAAPEVLAGKRYAGAPCDVWSLGVLLYTMVCCEFPFEQASKPCARFNSLSVGAFKFPDKTSSALCDLLLSMWQLEPTNRLGLQEIRQHEWLDDTYDAASLSYVPTMA